MGIPSYFSYIVKNQPEIIKRFLQKEMSVANLYLDCNSIIYDAFYKLNSDNNAPSYKNKPNMSLSRMSHAIISSVISKIEEYIEVIQPSHCVFIAFDGVAPVAKLKQQRERRYKSWYQAEITRILTHDNNIDKDKGKKQAWSTANITPGTQFMSDLNRRVSSHFHCSKICIQLGIQTVIVSGSNEAGEGEHKIFQHIRDNQTTFNTVVYGLDADLIMLSINHLQYCNNLYLFRETPHFIQSINRDLEPNEQYVLDIAALNRNIYIEKGLKDGDNIYNIEKGLKNGDNIYNIEKGLKEVVYSHNYVFLCFFLGNDFLPHFPSLNIRTGGVEKMLQAWEAIGKVDFITVDKPKVNILWSNVRKLVKWLSEAEEEYIVSEYKMREKREKMPLANSSDDEKVKKFELIPTYERDIEKYIKPTSMGWEKRYYMALFSENDTCHKITNELELIESISVNYLEGLEWTIKYYTQGCPDWRWKYKYHYPPLLKDLLRYIPLDSVPSTGKNHTFVPKQNENPVLPLTQLCYVLPRENLFLLPTELKDKMLKEHSRWYSDECSFVWAYCRYFWEAHVDMPEIDIEDLQEIIKDMNEMRK